MSKNNYKTAIKDLLEINRVKGQLAALALWLQDEGMKISNIELKPMGGVELMVTGVLNPPIWIEGGITTYRRDAPTFTIYDAWGLIDPDDDDIRVELSVAYVTDKLGKFGFFGKIFDEIKEHHERV